MKKQQFISFFLSGLLALSCLAQPAWATSQAAESTPPAETAPTETVPAEENSTLKTTDAVLTSETGIPSFETLSCKAALLVDADNQTVLYDQGGSNRVSPADTVKIMTALLTLEAIDRGELSLTDQVSITDTILSGVSSPDLKSGEVVTVEQLLNLLMLTSQDEAGYALANTVAGSNEAFVQRMNARAAELGCTNSNFVSPNGTQNSQQYSTCYDMYRISAEAMKSTVFQNIVAQGSYTLPETNQSDSRFYYNGNYLVSDRKATDYNYTYATGIKVGSNYEAGSCLVGSASYNGRTLIAIVMGATDSVDELGNVIRPGYDMAADLFRYGFVQFYPIQIASAGELVSQAAVTMGKDSDVVLLATANEVRIPLVCGLSKEDFSRELILPNSVQAPVSTGDVIGQMNFLYNGTVYASVDLVAMTNIDLSVSEQTRSMIAAFFGNPIVKVLIVLIVLVIVVLGLIILTNIITRNRSRKQQRSGQAPAGVSGSSNRSGKRTRKN